jgi:hypothetical protein
MKLFRFFVVSILFAIPLILTNVNSVIAQSSNITGTSCENGIVKGLICVPRESTYKLVKGEWSLYVDGVDGILNISSVEGGKINGTIVGGKFLCTESNPCLISGSFDATSGKVSFVSTPTLPTLIAIAENYTGHLSSQVRLDVVDYYIVGIGKEMKPVPGHEFGWYAKIRCLVVGCI